MRLLRFCIIGLPLLVAPLTNVAQNNSTADLPRFEVINIKPFSSGMTGVNVYPGGRIVVGGASLRVLIMLAFQVSSGQVSGDKTWANDEYVIEAKPSEDQVAKIKTLRFGLWSIEDEYLRQMLQSVLIDRFQLKFHRATTTGDVYLLERADKPLALEPTKIVASTGDISRRANLGYVGGRWSIRAMTMPQFAKFGEDYYLHAPIVDRTGLSGSFDYTQKQSDLDPAYSGPDSEVRFVRLISELGLKLTRTKGPIETFIIDSAARPN